jgi:hypothetical protein
VSRVGSAPAAFVIAHFRILYDPQNHQWNGFAGCDNRDPHDYPLFAEAHVVPSAKKTKAPSNLTIWSIIKKGKSSYSLIKRTMKRKAIEKTLAEQNIEIDPVKKGDKSLLFPGEGSSIISFAGIGELQRGSLFAREFDKPLVNTFNFPPKKLPLTSSRSFQLKGLTYTISASVRSAEPERAWNMRVHLRQGRNTQVLCSYQQADDAIAGLWLIADIDRDGRPDLLLSCASHYANATTTLYLSSRARRGSLVGAVARFSQGD